MVLHIGCMGIVVAVVLLISGKFLIFVAGEKTQAHKSKLDSTITGTDTGIYEYTQKGTEIALSRPHSWVSVRVAVLNQQAHENLLETLVPNPGLVNSSFFVEQPVYISLTTMASRINNVSDTISNLIQARVVPSHIYLFISKNPHLLDEGVKSIPDRLLCLSAAGYLTIVFTMNLGPHRKLLPVLKRYWTKDVFIATVDDDMIRVQAYVILYQLLKTHVLNHRPAAVVALRARRIAFCAAPPYRVAKYHSWPVVTAYNKIEMLVLPTGTGGVLYQPRYFSSFIFRKPVWYATGTADDMMFRLAAIAKQIPVLLGCSVLTMSGGRLVRTCKRDEWDRRYDHTFGFNSTNYYHELFASAYHRQPTNGTVLDMNFTSVTSTPSVLHAHKLNTSSRTVPSNATNTNNNNLESGGGSIDVSNTSLRRCLRGVTHIVPETTPATSIPADVVAANMYTKDERRHTGRQLYNLKTALKRQPRTGNETELFTINSNGGNDLAWKLAADVLKAFFNFNLATAVKEHVNEREESCYGMNRTVKVEKFCGLFDCNKPKVNEPLVSNSSSSDSLVEGMLTGGKNGSANILL